MSQDRPIQKALPERWTLRIRPRFTILAGVLATSLGGCMCLPAPSPSSAGIVGWGKPTGSDSPPIMPDAAAIESSPTPAVTSSARRGWLPPPDALSSSRPAGAKGLIGSSRLVNPPVVDSSLARTSSTQNPHSTAATPIGSALKPSPPAADIMTSAIPPAAGKYPIDLATALKLAERANPIIGEARAHIGEALAHQQQARVELLPWLNAGVTYDGHAGNLQRSDGSILNLSRQALYFGGGTMTSAQNTIEIPAVSIVESLADAIYDPLAAHQVVHQT
jgi:hypothetical protein